MKINQGETSVKVGCCLIFVKVSDFAHYNFCDFAIFEENYGT